ncbi:CDP-glucose 4,6-dehydratase [Ralstonia flaminis]|uniref:CDP-glucose 4,6-dehydratase n=1 Tax=Ralstonia flaminis TaxID=3058597 RepID=A0ABM9JZG2_9RALS|nr:CDP-glucose 4,6-dehydratase [Ralstonia sp. LMG 18101]CAJ0809358.1 CDP-glucose 4,6-dehydratase [Ralstonia sp. LMG 18101]
MLNPVAWAGKRVFLTGHTGFKGSWLALWLRQLGAEVYGYSLAPETLPSLFTLADVESTLAGHTLGDIRDADGLHKAMTAARPDVVFHLAAQPLVRASYKDPLATYATNVMGTVNVLEAARGCTNLSAIVVATTDKCYDNREWAWGYRETDALGGHDPYSASKACAELVAASYRRAFFANGPLLATGRAGNVIGGGDWSEDRLIPDAERAMRAGTPLVIRSPHATRPWQHVLDCLHGYLVLAQRLQAGDASCAAAWNFGPDSAATRTVEQVLQGLQQHWPTLIWQLDTNTVTGKHEAGMLHLDASRARQQLGWQTAWSFETALEHTAAWYRQLRDKTADARTLCDQQIDRFTAVASTATSRSAA